MVNFITKRKSVKNLPKDIYSGCICGGFEESQDPVYKDGERVEGAVRDRIHVLFEIPVADKPTLAYKVEPPADTIYKDGKLYGLLNQVTDVSKIKETQHIFSILGALYGRKFTVVTDNTVDGIAWITSVKLEGEKIDPDSVDNNFSWLNEDEI